MGSSPFRACQEKAGPSPEALHSDSDSSYHTRSSRSPLPQPWVRQRAPGEGWGAHSPVSPAASSSQPWARTSVTGSAMSRGNRSDLRSPERRWQLSPTVNREQRQRFPQQSVALRAHKELVTFVFLELCCKPLALSSAQPYNQPSGAWRKGAGWTRWSEVRARPHNVLGGFLEELLGGFLLQPLTAGIHQLGGDFRHVVLALGTKAAGQTQ